MTDRRRHVSESFQIAGIKNSMTSVASNSQNAQRPNTGLQQPFVREEAPGKTTQYTLLQLINMVRENPILYDEEMQASMPDSQLKVQKREIWDRIRNDIVWQDVSLVQEVWCDLLDQYSRKSIDMSDSLIDAMRWTDSIIKKKGESRPPSQMNPLSSGLEKDFYNDVPLADDVLEPGPSPTMKYDYVVIQPPSIGHVRTSVHQPVQPSQNNTQYPQKRRSPSPRETEAIVRSYPLDSPKRINHRIPSQQEHKLATPVKKEPSAMSYNRQSLVVEGDPTAYGNTNTKMYKVIRNSTHQATVHVTPNRRIHQIPHESSNIGYETMPDQIIEPPTHSEPPRKKIMIDARQRSNTVAGPSSSRMPATHSGPIQNVKMINSSGPLVEEDIIMGESREIKIGPSGLIMTSQHTSSAGDLELDPSSSDDQMHHYHHQDIEDGGVVDDIEQQIVVTSGPNNEISMQYNEDVAFQQHINSILNRLSDEDKTLIKFNMQKIILDAKFGPGTARNILKEDDLLEIVESQVEIDVDPVSNEDQI
ncbi:hypothetical protein L5515_003606 [Caenorhabditis briggsae]|uniref:MADF domain-containing protein n=2 Tax=Caenorhabditis briggsae TaxID=6238 RepID=A0AAE9EJS9_CAEBR|nr:hypothetical protein L5515_003606 [Caenorhabditis briggsae]UMM22346.1 hypothetical protein L5515_003606 [Caenorhabditis briggsae]